MIDEEIERLYGPLKGESLSDDLLCTDPACPTRRMFDADHWHVGSSKEQRERAERYRREARKRRKAGLPVDPAAINRLLASEDALKERLAIEDADAAREVADLERMAALPPKAGE